MSTPDAQDASPSPEYHRDHDDTIDMAEQKNPLPAGEASPAQQNTTQKSSNAKDPTRPRRKKARRACFACQRAHLTCGDERPCHRCIKRNLGDVCTDGVRKKAKYLHDAPNEALNPVLGPYHLNGGQTSNLQSTVASPTQQRPYYSQSQPASFAGFPQDPNQPTMTVPIQDGTFPGQSPISPSYNSSQQTSPIQNIQTSLSQGSPANMNPMNQFGGQLMDPNDPMLYNFDIASLNFGNHYGALEFGMLANMSSGAAETPPGENSMGSLGQGMGMFNSPITTGFDGTPGLTTTLSFGADGLQMADWPNHRPSSVSHGTSLGSNMDSSLHQDSFPLAYAIAAGSGSMSSPSPNSNQSNESTGYENNINQALFSPVTSQQPQQQQNRQSYGRPQRQQMQPQSAQVGASVTYQQQKSFVRKPRTDSSQIYDAIQEPYSYTAAFHRLLDVIRKRFPQQAVIRIAKALAAIRPSFIACSSWLDRSDLIHSERNFQRTLVDYVQHHIEASGTPTLILRRTGEVAAAGNEFSMLSGWRRDVLLGNQQNLNVNRGALAPSLGTVSDSEEIDGNGAPVPQPVLLAELLDEDSVVKFYEDYAEVAFGDPRGKVTRPCKLLKYRTQEDLMTLEEGKGLNGNTKGHGLKLDRTIHNEAGMHRLGAKEGMVDCMMCWMVRHDSFGIPLLIVMNFLPCLP